MSSANFQVHIRLSALELELHSGLEEQACCAVLPEILVSLRVQPLHLQMVASSTVLLGP